MYYDDDEYYDYNFNDTDATEEREKSSQSASESNAIPVDDATTEEETEDLVPENIERDATQEGKILGGASVKSLDTEMSSREELVLTSDEEETVRKEEEEEEAVRDASSDLDGEQLMKMEESKNDTATDEKVETDEDKEREKGHTEALSSTAPPSLVAFSFLTILASNLALST